MKPVGIVLALCFATCALAATVWLSRSYGVSVVKPPAGSASTDNDNIGPPVSATGPYPKAVVDEKEYDFGAMEHGTKGEHVFVIRNEGEAPLQVMAREEDTTCQCTIGTVEGEGIPPGESGKITLTWEIKSPNPDFRHFARIRTNDPENRVIELVIKGRVEKTFDYTPSETWTVGDVTPSSPVEISGKVYSKLFDEFKVTGVTTSIPQLQATVEPLDDEELTKLEAKSGYSVQVTLQPRIPVGPFNETVTLHTDARGGTDAVIHVTGRRTAELEIVGPPGQWYADRNVLRVGEFPAGEGKKVDLGLYLDDFGEPLKLLNVEAKPDEVQVSLEKDERFKSHGKRQRYFLHIVIPPGKPVARTASEIERVLLTLNHPQVQQLKLALEYYAQGHK